MDKNKILSSGLLEQYILGLTTPAESEEVERCAEMYPEVREKLEAIQASFDDYMAEQDIPPHPANRTRTLSRRAGGAPRTSVMWPVLALGLFCISTFLLHQNRTIHRSYEHLHRECMDAMAACESTSREQQRVIAFLNDPNTMPVILRGLNTCPRGVALAYWNPVKAAGYLHIVELPAPPVGHQYQVWADVDGVMVNAGLIEHHHDLQPILFRPDAASLNVTIEPKGGSEHPTVDLLVLNGGI